MDNIAPKKSNKLLFVLLPLLAVLLGIGGFCAWYFWPSAKVDMESYEPAEEFAPAFNAMRTEAKEATYDIEETVRIMNALEVAQTQSADFMSFLDYMARQDYSRVAPDVIEQKKRLFPVMQHLFELQKQHKELDDSWMLMQSAGKGAGTLVSDMNPIGMLGSLLTGDATLASFSLAGSIDKAQTAAFEEYENQKKLKGKLEDEIDQVRMEYLQYMEDYAPVYFKYMKEWDALCLKKDKAYLDLYSGRSVDAYNHLEEILKDYPTNREALLLKSLSLINIANNFNVENGALLTDADPQAEATDDTIPDPVYSQKLMALCKDMNIMQLQPTKANEFYAQADATLDEYIRLYPSRSAPALVLKGLLCRSTGQAARALSYFDQASMEYPRQAADLTDLLDAYRSRTYLNRTSEGKYLLRLYRATMEGFGIFSPNLLKANYYSQLGDDEQSKTEIFNHFFRRGNQGVYHCLLSDMLYCEENMYSSFKQILIEQSFLDVNVEPTTDWKLSDNDDEIQVKINNRSDIDLENVRIFLCLHYTDMYRDEYDVQKLPTVNIIMHGKETNVGVVKLQYEDKKYDDITRIRAIAMTDDKICWIDNVDYKYKRAADTALKSGKASPSSASYRERLAQMQQQLLRDFGVTPESLCDLVQTGMGVAAKIAGEGLWSGITSGVSNIMSGQDNKLHVKLPRILTIIDPVFSVGSINYEDKAIRPSESYLSGSYIYLTFDYKPKRNDTIPLYIYSEMLNMKVTIKFVEGEAKITNVERF